MGKSLEQQALDVVNDPKAPKVSDTRAKSVIALRTAGVSFTKIAEMSGFTSAAVARRVWEEALASTVDDIADVAHQRAIAVSRHERLLQSIFSKAIKENDPRQLDYVRAAADLTDRIANLTGAAAPKKIEVFTPSQEEKVVWMQEALRVLTDETREVEETDIIDAEVMEDGDG